MIQSAVHCSSAWCLLGIYTYHLYIHCILQVKHVLSKVFLTIIAKFIDSSVFLFHYLTFSVLFQHNFVDNGVDAQTVLVNTSIYYSLNMLFLGCKSRVKDNFNQKNVTIL